MKNIEQSGYVVSEKVLNERISDYPAHGKSENPDDIADFVENEFLSAEGEPDFRTSRKNPLMRLSGAKFALYLANGTLLGEYTTNNSGEIVAEDLSYGEYYVVETQAPSGFVLDTAQHHFCIAEDEKIAEVIIKDARPDIPNTGDQTNMALWVGLLWLSCVVLLSCGGAALILFVSSKRDKKKGTILYGEE